MRWRRLLQVVAVGLTLLSPALIDASSQSRIAVSVGPQTRGGFVDVDSGTIDSIKDIQDELRKSDAFTLVAKSDDAKIVLLVAGRRVITGGGGVAVGSVIVPLNRRSIETVLKVGSYEKSTVSESDGGGTWRSAAKQVVKDLTVWADANRAQIAK